MGEAKIILEFKPFLEEKKVYGVPCSACKVCIYGPAFQVILMVNTDRFSSTDIILCEVCKDGFKW